MFWHNSKNIKYLLNHDTKTIIHPQNLDMLKGTLASSEGVGIMGCQIIEFYSVYIKICVSPSISLRNIIFYGLFSTNFIPVQ